MEDEKIGLVLAGVLDAINAMDACGLDVLMALAAAVVYCKKNESDEEGLWLEFSDVATRVLRQYESKSPPNAVRPGEPEPPVQPPGESGSASRAGG